MIYQDDVVYVAFLFLANSLCPAILLLLVVVGELPEGGGRGVMQALGFGVRRLLIRADPWEAI